MFNSHFYIFVNYTANLKKRKAPIDTLQGHFLFLKNYLNTLRTTFAKVQ